MATHNKFKAILQTLLVFCTLSVMVFPTYAVADNNDSKGILDSLSSLGSRFGFSDEEEIFLKPDKAFIFSYDFEDANTILANWHIADGYYMYREKFAFKVLDGQNVSLGQPKSPPGKFKTDETFGDTEVYYKQVSLILPVQHNNITASPMTLEVRYQGCADAGFCYPPITKSIDLKLPGISTNQINKVNFAGLSEQDRIAQSLAGSAAWLTILSFFGIGLFLAFTPCVLPMVPILSSIIIGQKEQVTTGKAFSLSLAYVLAMSLTYTIAGIFTGLFGKNLQIIFQNPWIIGSFSALFVLLSLSMFGLYSLQMPSAIQTKLNNLGKSQSAGTYLGAGVMGFLSALIVGPCVAAPLAGILIYIGLNGDAAFGGLALFTLSMGMGLPLLVLGTSAGKLMPKVGPWMNSIKVTFGVMLLSLAIWMLDRIVPGQVTLALSALLVVGLAVYIGALTKLDRHSTAWQKLSKGTGIVLIVYGVTLIVGAVSGSKDLLQPLQGIRTALSSNPNNVIETQPITFTHIKSLEDLNRAVSLAKSNQQTLMLDFYADWCIDCKRMEKRTFSNSDVKQALSNTVLLQADVTGYDDIDQELLNYFGLPGPPAILFFTADGQESRRHRLIGFLAADDFYDHVTNGLI